MDQWNLAKIFGLLLLLPSALGKKKPEPVGFRLVVFHTNDMHSRFNEIDLRTRPGESCDESQRKCVYGGFPRLKTAYLQKQAEAMKDLSHNVIGTVFLNAGDTFQGTGFYTKFNAQKAGEMFQDLGIQAMILGTNELCADLNELTTFIHAMPNIPIIMSNLLVLERPIVVGWETVKFESTTITVNGHKIGIVGYMTPDAMALDIIPRLKIVDDLWSLRKEVNRMEDEGILIIIALVHAGIDMAKMVARDVHGVDMVISGLSHTFLYTGDDRPDIEEPTGPYPILVEQVGSNLMIPVVQAFNSTKYLGQLFVDFNGRGEVTESSGNPILLDSSFEQDAEMLKLVNDYFENDIDVFEREVIGSTAVYLEGKPEYCMLKECNFGNFALDSYRNYVKKQHHLKKVKDKDYSSGIEAALLHDIWTDEPIVIVNGSAFRYDMSIGQITHDQLRAAISDDEMVEVKLFGSDILKEFQRAFMKYDGKTPQQEFLQVSGLKVKINLSKKGGDRIMSIQFGPGVGGIEDDVVLDQTNEYTVVLSEDLWTNGFRGYANKSIMKIEKFRQTLFDVTKEAIEDCKTPIAPNHDQRIMFFHDPK